MKKAYYARPMSIYQTPQEARDKQTILQCGFDPIEINKQELQALAAAKGMEVFEPLVRQAEALFFRAFCGGMVGAGVAKEIAWAIDAGIPVIELPSGLSRRTLTVDQTRECLAEMGQR